MRKAALICVTRNNAEKLQTTLNSVIRNTKPEHYDLFIIDNASSDSTLGIYQLPVLADNITIVRSGRDLHRVGGINLGIEMTKGYQYIGFLHDDIEVCPNWLENFFDVLDSNPNVAAVGPITSNLSDWQGYDNICIRFPDWGYPDLKNIDRQNVADMHAVIKNNGAGCTISDALSFHCIFLRRSVFQSVGLLDEDFSEVDCGYDEDFCKRLQKFNYNLALSTKTYIAQFPSKSKSFEEKKLKALEILKSKMQRFAKHQTTCDESQVSNKVISSFIQMRPYWEPLMKLMPFHNFCAELVSSSIPFPQLGSYVFNPGRSLALCTLYTPEIVSYAAECEKSLLSYCLQHDYTAYIYRNGIYGGIHPAWHKSRVLLNHLESHGVMVWMDADTLILKQQDTKLKNIAEKSKLFYISKDISVHTATPYNSGVFIVKNHPWAFDLLEACDRFTLKHKPAKLWDHGSDQKVLCDMLLSRDPHREFHEVYEMSEFNTDPRFMDEETFLLHFMSYPAGYRIPWMHYWNANNLNFREEDFLDRIIPLPCSVGL